MSDDKLYRAKVLAYKDQAWESIHDKFEQIMQIGIHGVRNDSDAHLCKRICSLLTADYLLDMKERMEEGE